MNRIGFKMDLLPGSTAEYRNRHDNIWPELKELLKATGISAYSIFLEEETNVLFAVFTATDRRLLDSLSSHLLMKKWWNYMRDITKSNPDGTPVITPLTEVFYLA
ncbi:MAG TPA: L-rhamnose mutarotase [Mucilaginibacter sp.]|jgi:L-rhamnose mutarotase|nr:L-rhamnose mutarotase [Mucilaginibacter sp.]